MIYIATGIYIAPVSWGLAARSEQDYLSQTFQAASPAALFCADASPERMANSGIPGAAGIDTAIEIRSDCGSANSRGVGLSRWNRL